jgi:hypothetical protein
LLLSVLSLDNPRKAPGPIVPLDQGNLAIGSIAPEHDIINVHGYYGFAGWSALQALISNNSAGDAVVQLSTHDSITLIGVHTAALLASDFII